jgi:diguanylate cyclase (GGDEF)-like protein
VINHPYLPYAITEVYLIVFAATIWVRLDNSIGSEHEVQQLRNMIFSYFGMLATDLIWAFSEDGMLHLPHTLYAFVNAVTIICVTCGCYFWFRFIEDRLHFLPRRKAAWDLLLRIPLLAVCALDLLSIFTGWIFYIDADGSYQVTDLFLIPSIVNYLYLLLPTGYSIYRAVKTHSRQERSEYWTYSLYMIAPLISGLLEDTFPNVPLLALNIFVMILILFLMIENKQVYNDALTGLNNRRRLNQYLEDTLPRASAEHPILLFIMDINDFKSVNDVYGHLEGDKALASFSAILRTVASRYNAFIARYGGDEFCLAMPAAGHTPEEITADIENSLAEAQSSRTDKPYVLTASIGCAVCNNAGEDPDVLLQNADHMLYDHKKIWHAAHPQD